LIDVAGRARARVGKVSEDADGQIDALIERRLYQQLEHDLWAESDAWHRAEMARKRRRAWYGWHVAQAARLQRTMSALVAHHEERAARLLEEGV